MTVWLSSEISERSILAWPSGWNLDMHALFVPPAVRTPGAKKKWFLSVHGELKEVGRVNLLRSWSNAISMKTNLVLTHFVM